MKLDERFSVPPHVIARTVGQDTVILDMESAMYFGLDPVGARMWALIEGGNSLAEVCATIQREYEVERENVERDALALARDLLEKKLILAS